MHGGLSPDMTDMANFDPIRNIQRPIDIPDVGLLCDLLWSDPDGDVTGWSENDRGVSFTFGPDVVQKFLQKHDLDLIVRAHQVVEDGYEFFGGPSRPLITVFSAPNYCDQFQNSSAVICISEDLLITIMKLKPAERKMKFVNYGGKSARPATPPGSRSRTKNR